MSASGTTTTHIGGKQRVRASGGGRPRAIGAGGVMMSPGAAATAADSSRRRHRGARLGDHRSSTGRGRGRGRPPGALGPVPARGAGARGLPRRTSRLGITIFHRLSHPLEGATSRRIRRTHVGVGPAAAGAGEGEWSLGGRLLLGRPAATPRPQHGSISQEAGRAETASVGAGNCEGPLPLPPMQTLSTPVACICRTHHHPC